MSIKYKWLATKLKEQMPISLQKGIDKLPSENELCKKYRVSRQTVRQALQVLEKDGFIEKKQGSGSFYTGLSPDSAKNCIALIFPSNQEYDYPNLIHSIESLLWKQGFSTDLYITDYNLETERKILTTLCTKSYRGILVEGIYSALPNPNLDLYKALLLADTAILFVRECYQTTSDVLTLQDANQKGAKQLMDFFAALGHTDIVGIFQIDSTKGQQRYDGFMTSHREIKKTCFGYQTKDVWRLRDSKDTNWIDMIVEQLPAHCSAILCDQDEIAYELAHSLRAKGYAIPEKIMLATFGNTFYCDSGVITLTSLSHRQNELAETAVDMLLKKCKGLPVTSQEIPWHLIIRQSAHE